MFACTKFHDYIYGKEVIIESDHKPLETIFKKQLEKAPACLKNMLLKLQKYNLKVVYKREKKCTSPMLSLALTRIAIQTPTSSFSLK